MSDPNTDQNPYQNGELPADADLNDETTPDEVADLLPGGSRLNEGVDNPNEPLDDDDVQPDGAAALP